MEGIWASIENTSDGLWSSVEAFWSGKDTAWWNSDGPSQWDQFVYFVTAVDWTEPWILILMSFHLLTFFTIILSWGYFNVQAVILVLLALICVASEWINKLAAENYRLFTDTQYFDSTGFFIFVVLAGPIIFNCFLIIISWLHLAWKLMVKVAVLKRRATERKSKQDRKQTKKVQ